MSDLDQQLRQLFREKEPEVGPPPPVTLPLAEAIDAQQSPDGPSRFRPLLQITASAAVVALVVLGVNVLRIEVSRGPASIPEQTWADALGDVSPLAMPKTLPQLHAQTNLPDSVPGPNDDPPSLLDEPPGRALMTWYPAPASGCDVQGWARETIDFYGLDGRWRRLNMADLDLPESAWTGCGTYGAGSLSPDGRWWVTGAKGLFVLIDLATGTFVTEHSNTPWPGGWTPNSRQFLTEGNKVRSLWRVPGIHVLDSPRDKESGIAWLLPDGGYVIDEDTKREDPDGGLMTLRYYTPTGEPSETRQVPTPPASHCSVEGGFVGDRVGMVCVTKRTSEPHIFYVLDESSWRVEAALETPAGGDPAYPQQLLKSGLWALWGGDNVGIWHIDDGRVGKVVPLPDEPKSAKWYAFNQWGLAGDLVTD